MIAGILILAFIVVALAVHLWDTSQSFRGLFLLTLIAVALVSPLFVLFLGE